MKSKYPNQIDTSEELPIVRDNITEIGSEILNSLRSAVIQLQKTLGTNPQGSVGNTVAQRLAAVLDDSGNLLPDAIEKIGLLTGPIVNNDVSYSAGIKESKLDLDFPTSVLQSEISSLNSELLNLIAQINALAASYTSHINPSGINKHPASAIKVSDIAIQSSIDALTSVPESNLQDALQYILDAHVGYSGDNISLINNSHRAEQIYFDSSLISDLTEASDVQSAIQDLASGTSSGMNSNLANLNSNGRIRKGEKWDEFEGNLSGSKLLTSALVNYPSISGNKTTTFSLIVPKEPLDPIFTFDILRLSNSLNLEDNKDYQVSKVNYSGLNITSIEVFGSPSSNWNAGISIEVFKNKIGNLNEAGLLTTARPRFNSSLSEDILLINPNSAFILSQGLDAGKITSSSEVEITVDEELYTLNAFHSSFSQQTVDSLVLRLNEQIVEQRLPIICAKIRNKNKYEILISHIVPNIAEDSYNRTLTISASSSELGFSYIHDVVFEGTTSNKFFINGKVFKNPIQTNVFNYSKFQSVVGTSKLIISSGSNFSYGISAGDTVSIFNPSNPSQGGTFRVGSVSSTQITLDYSGFTFSSLFDSSVTIVISSNALQVDGLSFENIISETGSMLLDVFCDSDMSYFFSKRMEVDGDLKTSGFSAIPVDVSKGFLLKEEQATINISTSGYAYLTFDSQNGPSVFLAGSGVYTLLTADRASYVKLLVEKTANPLSAKTATLYGFNEVSSSNYLISRNTFSTFHGPALGVFSGKGILNCIDKRKSGTTDESNISESFVEKYIEAVRNEIRSSGVISNCEVISAAVSSGYQHFTVDSGVVLSSGIRYEINSISEFRVNSLSNYYVAIDSYGIVIAQPEVELDGSMVSPFYNQGFVHLAYVSAGEITDLRFFVDRLDLKVSNELIVSATGEFGHFKSLPAAIFYARNCKKINSLAPTPVIKLTPGEFELSSQILIDFDVKIVGSGPSTIIKRSSAFSAGTTSDPSSSLFVIGGSTSEDSDNILSGVTFSDFTYKSELSSLVSSLFWLSQGILNNQIFQFQNIRFIGPAGMSQSDPLGEFFLTIGKKSSTSPFSSSNYDCGNIFITNCFFDRCGLEYGCITPISFSGASISNVVITSNVATRISPNVEDIDAMIFRSIYPAVETYNIVEASNAIVLTGSSFSGL
jgi:hypothetical protein